MPVFDPRTVERIAKMICDIDGPYERRGYELANLLQRAGWSDPPEYDNSYRVPWLITVMEERAERSGDIERLLCRVCNPVEYDDGMDSAEYMRQALNQALNLQGLSITYVGGQPVLGELKEDGTATMYTAPEDLPNRLEMLISDTSTVEWLLHRVEETRICEASGAYVFALIGIGSFVEYLLISVLSEWDQDIKDNGFRDERGRRIDPKHASLDFLIKTAHAKDWIQLDRKDFIDHVRDYRNFVHLRRQAVRDLKPDWHTVMMCWGPVRAVLNDLEVNVRQQRTASHS